MKQLQKPLGGYVTSSIWSSFRAHYSDPHKEGLWLIGANSQRDFWHDNWLGVPILDILGIPNYLATFLRAKVFDFIVDGSWVLHEDFRIRFPDICLRIDQIAISPIEDSFVWSLSNNGLVSCKAAYCEMIQEIPQVS